MTLAVERTDNFNRYVILSLVFHLGIVLVFTVKAVFFPAEPMNFSPSIRVDLVALPEKIQPEAMQEVPLEEPKPMPAVEKKMEPIKPKVEEPPKVVLNKNAKQEQKKALEKLKAMEALEKIMSEEKNKKKAKPFQYKGNVLSSGTELTGLDRMQHDDYQNQIDRHVKKFWYLPEWMARANLKAQAIVKIDERGYVTFKAIRKTSNNSTYDELVLDTIQKASPFPAPPNKFSNIVSVDGIILGFPE